MQIYISKMGCVKDCWKLMNDTQFAANQGSHNGPQTQLEAADQNRQTIKQQKKTPLLNDKLQQLKVQHAMQEWICGGIEEMSESDKCDLSTCHSYYSSFIPIKLQSRFRDELTLAFPTLLRLQETGRLSERVLLLVEISQFMRGCAARGEVDRGWLRCLRKYICQLDSLRALEVFLEVKKRGGVKPSSQFHRQFGGECMPRIFFERIQWCAQFLKKPRQAFCSQQLSVEFDDEVSQISMPKTMKQLFCWICWLYDCGIHTMEESVKERGFHYGSPVNIIKPKDHIAAGTLLYAHYQHLLKLGSIQKDSTYLCCSKCYKYLTTALWEELQIKRGSLLSPLVKGIIRLGIHIFSYSPCHIWFLLSDRGITCAMVFLFLMEDLNLKGLLSQKLQLSQADALLRVRQYQVDGQMPTQVARLQTTKKRKVKVADNEQIIEISACVHFFLNEGVADYNCEGCACVKRGFCLPQCLCDAKCPIRKQGCQCKKDDCRGEKCPCFKLNQECDPYLCKNCFSKNQCRNHQVIDGGSKRVRVGRSTIGGAGLGLFACEAIRPHELLMTYSGELIDFSIDLLRQSLSIDSTFYNFSSKEGAIDARFMGNLARFINHADQDKENLYSQLLLTQGRFKIAFFAKREIQPKQQLFFDYDGEGKLYANYKDKYPFINKKKNKKA